MRVSGTRAIVSVPGAVAGARGIQYRASVFQQYHVADPPGRLTAPFVPTAIYSLPLAGTVACHRSGGTTSTVAPACPNNASVIRYPESEESFL